MPIEIKELHIKLTVNPQATEPGSPGAGGGSENQAKQGNKTEELVATCVEKVMEILHNKMQKHSLMRLLRDLILML